MGMITYDICCEDCGKVIGYVSYESEPSPETKDRQCSGYMCEECAAEVLESLNIEK
jgi:hypothetical protein